VIEELGSNEVLKHALADSAIHTRQALNLFGRQPHAGHLQEFRPNPFECFSICESAHWSLRSDVSKARLFVTSGWEQSTIAWHAIALVCSRSIARCVSVATVANGSAHCVLSIAARRSCCAPVSMAID